MRRRRNKRRFRGGRASIQRRRALRKRKRVRNVFGNRIGIRVAG